MSGCTENVLSSDYLTGGEITTKPKAKEREGQEPREASDMYGYLCNAHVIVVGVRFVTVCKMASMLARILG